MRNRTALSLCVVTALISTTATAYSATEQGPRYTMREITKLHQHSCTEDEYMFIPARYVNPRVTYNTPDAAFCVAIESIRKAPIR